jgi:predicted ATPase
LLSLTEDLFGESGGFRKPVEALDVYSYLGHMLSVQLEGPALARVQPLEPQALQAQYLTAIRRLLQAMAGRIPLVLILEDLHWADPSSVELLRQLLPLASTEPLVFCLVTRPERDTSGWKLVTAARDLLGGGLTELTLKALSDTESRQLVSNLLEIEALPEGTRTAILERAEGNPFFVEEVIRMLIDRRAISWQEGRWVAATAIDAVEIPHNLQGLLLARIDRLPEEARKVLRVASVIGRQFPVKVLAQLMGEGGAR